jgi:5-methylcytosine-specific restriction endonuclease McrA
MDDATRQIVRDRAAGRCEYCQLSDGFSGLLPFHVDHVRAKQHRGTDELGNICYACSRCNHFKGPNPSSYDPVTDQLTRLYDPRRDDWHDHFHLEGPIIVGITPEGRATIELLQMNDGRRVNLRAALHEEGKL